MRAYADSSFLVKLLGREPGTATAVDLFRGLGRPSLLFLPLHGLEVANAIRQRAFHQRRSAPAAARTAITRERNVALALLEKFMVQRVFLATTLDLDPALDRARQLSEKHTERLGCRGFDLLHVALALELRADVFLTSDRMQGILARAESLTVSFAADE